MKHVDKIAIVGKAALFPDGDFGNLFSSPQTDGDSILPISRKIKRYMATGISSAIEVSESAFLSAGVNPLDKSDNIGIYAGQYGYLHPDPNEFIPAFVEDNPTTVEDAFRCAWSSSKVSPFIITTALNNNLLGLLSLHWGIAGDSSALLRDSLCSVNAISEAIYALQQNSCDIALATCSGAESVSFVNDSNNSETKQVVYDDPETGVVAIILKRLSEAEQNGDHIEAVIDQVFSEYDLNSLLEKINVDIQKENRCKKIVHDLSLKTDCELAQEFLQTKLSISFEDLAVISGERGCPGLLSVLFAALSENNPHDMSLVAISGSVNQHYCAISMHRNIAA